MSKNSPELTRARSAAANYAKTFLANKYQDEYSELYQAYLINRGFSTRNHDIVDERELLRTDSVQVGE